MTYLEKLAKAAADDEWRGEISPESWKSDRDYWIKNARAILTAMKDPPHEITEPVVPVGEDRTEAV